MRGRGHPLRVGEPLRLGRAERAEQLASPGGGRPGARLLSACKWVRWTPQVTERKLA